MDDLTLAAALLVLAVLAILIACVVMAAWSWFAERGLDVVFGAIETALRWLVDNVYTRR